MHRESSQLSVVGKRPYVGLEEAFTGHYEVLRDLGYGGFGQVKVARHLVTGAEVAVKVVPKVERNLPVLSEADIMKTLSHPHVIQLFQVIETHENVYIVMEHAARGTLLDQILRGGMDEDEARRLFQQMAWAVCYCHRRGIVHRDLKPENMVLDASGNVKLVDFGLSVRFKPGQKLTRFWGTVQYLAPEILQRKEHEGPPVDIWSLGVILYLMLTGTYPFRGANNRELRKQILFPKLDIPQHVPAQAQSLLKDILTVDTMARLSIEEILEDPWVSQGEKILSFSPDPLPVLRDPTILTVLFDMGYDPYETWQSLSERKFDDVMATYLIVQHQLCQGACCVFQVKPVPARVMSQTQPVNPSRVPVLQKRSASEPALRTFPLPCERQLPKEAKWSGQKDMRRAGQPAIDLCSLPARTPIPSLASQEKPVSPMPPGDSSSFSQESPTGQLHGKGWKRVRRTIAACFRRLCCCVPRGRENEAPPHRGQKRARLGNRVAPM